MHEYPPHFDGVRKTHGQKDIEGAQKTPSVFSCTEKNPSCVKKTNPMKKHIFPVFSKETKNYKIIDSLWCVGAAVRTNPGG